MTIKHLAQDTHTLFLPVGTPAPVAGSKLKVNGLEFTVTGGNPTTRKGPQVWFKGQGFGCARLPIIMGQELSIEIGE